MTYYEWVNYFYSLQNAPISDDIINTINNANIDNYKGNIKVRYLNHIVKLINFRLNNALDNFLQKSRKIALDKNTLSIEISDLKKEIVFTKKLASVKHFEENTKNDLINNISNFANEMNDIVKKSYANCNSNEIIMIINSIDFNN